MKVILIRWYINKGMESDFISYWKYNMAISKGKGLHRETLCEVDSETADPKFHTFDIEHPLYTTFVNVGMWDSVDSFDKAVTKSFIKPAIHQGDDRFLHLTKFEFKIRERIVLTAKWSRGVDIPPADSEE